MMNSSDNPGSPQRSDPPVVTAARFDVDLRRTTVTADATQREAAQRAASAAQAAGYAAGWAEGRRAAAAAEAEEIARLRQETQAALDAQANRVEQALHALTTAANRLDQRATPGMAELQQTVVDAVFTLAKAVIGHELAVSQTPGADAIARALAAVPQQGEVVIHLHPADLATLGETGGVSGELSVAGRRVVVLSDPGLRPGDAVAQCDATTVDARVAQAVERIREVLTGASQ